MRLRSLTLITVLICTLSVAQSGASPDAQEVRVDGSPGTFRVAATGSSTYVDRIVGSLAWTTTVPGRWALPVVAARDLLGGASADGTALALVPATKGRTDVSRFLVVRRDATKTVTAKAKTVSLKGEWNFDALSVDGRTLYLTESVGRGRYWVRAVDVATSRAGDPIVTKSITPTSVEVEDGPMAGRPMDRVVTTDGRTVFTLYAGPSYPFVHALDVANGGALCYELIGIPVATTPRLRLRFGQVAGSVDVRNGAATIAQIWTPSSLYGPSVRIGGTANAPRCVHPRAMISPVAGSTITAPTAGLGAVFPKPRRAT